MDQKEEVYLSKQIIETIDAVQSAFFDWSMRDLYDRIKPDDNGWEKSWMISRIQELHYLIIAYLEQKNVAKLCEMFISETHHVVTNSKNALDSELRDPEGEPELIILRGYRKYLDAFRVFNISYLNETESNKLFSILKNTDFIIKNCGITIKGEADIYKQVRWVLSLFYTSIRSSQKVAFIGKFKTYKPDLLIPEISTAIEYKYINSPKDNIEDFINQIHIDSINYKGDINYQYFIAVIYLEDSSLATPENISIAWKEKHFPPNWELIVVVGSPTSKM